MNEPVCCVCHQPCPSGSLGTLGGRLFCAAHHKRAERAGTFQWTRTGLIEVGIVVAVLLAMGWGVGQGVSPELGMMLGLGVAAFVPLVFLFYIYHQDRLEPEPPAMVMGLFGLGALLGYGVAQPMAKWALGLESWTHLSDYASLIGALCIVGTLQETCKYVAVRYTVYFTDEFDEPVDGIIYTTAAGLGLATAINMSFVVEHGGILTWAGCVFLASTTLIHVASSSILGYGLGRQRFASTKEPWLLPLSFILAIIVTGWGSEMVLSMGVDPGGFSGTRALGVAVAIACVALIGSQFATTRLRREALAKEQVVKTQPSLVDPITWGAALVLLGTGVTYPMMNQQAPKDFSPFDGQATLQLPADWLITESDDVFEARPFDGMGTALTLKRIRKADGNPVPPYLIDVELTRLEDDTAKSGFGYRLLNDEGPDTFNTHTVAWTRYAIARNPPGCTNKSQVLPIVYVGLDAFITTEKGGAWSFGLTAPADDFNIEAGPLADALKSLRVEL